MPIYLGNQLISGGGGGDGVSAQFIVDFLINGMSDWCEMSDSYGITGEVFSIIIGPDFDAYKNLETAEDIYNDGGALQAVFDSPDAQDAVKKSQWAKDAGLLADPLDGVSIGDAFMGGFFAGIIDTTRVGSITVNDYYQAGLRYALIVSPKSIEAAAGKKWDANNGTPPAQTTTEWNGLGATLAMVAGGANFEAAKHCNDQSYPSDGASQWYLPAMAELELIYRNLKATTETNYTSNRSGADFPRDPQVQGYNPCSDPAGVAYTGGSPAQTSVALFKTGGAQALGVNGSNVYYWSSTKYSSTLAWCQGFSGTSAGSQADIGFTYTGRLTRPSRRLILSS